MTNHSNSDLNACITEIAESISEYYEILNGKENSNNMGGKNVNCFNLLNKITKYEQIHEILLSYSNNPPTGNAYDNITIAKED